MEVQKIASLIITASQRIDQGTKEIYKMAKNKAETEQQYRIALAKQKLILKSEGMAISLIEDVARGTEDIAALKFQRDYAEDMYKAAIESLRALRSELSGLQSLLRNQEEI